MKLYRIKDWSKHFEVSDSRKVDGPLNWVSVRTKTDGFGFRRIVSEKDRTDLLAAWYLLVGVAAKQPREERGKIARDGIPLQPDDLSVITGFPAQVFARALVFFSSEKQGWLVSEDVRTNPDEPGSGPDESRQTPATGQDRTGQDKKECAAAPLPFSSPDFSEAWNEFAQHRKEKRKPLTPTSTKAALRMLAEMGERRAIATIRHTVAMGWQGLREPDHDPKKGEMKDAPPERLDRNLDPRYQPGGEFWEPPDGSSEEVWRKFIAEKNEREARLELK